MIKWIKWLKKEIWFFYKTHQNRIRYRYYKYRALQLHKQDGKRYYVIPAGKKIHVLNNEGIKLYNKWVGSGPKLDINKVLKIASYYTPERGKTDKLMKKESK